MAIDIEAIKSKLKKILNLAKRASSPGEAAAAAAAAQRVARKYEVDLATIEVTGDNGDGRQGGEAVLRAHRTGTKGKPPSWMGILMDGVCKGNGCRVVYSWTGFDIVGQAWQIEIVKYLFEHLKREVNRLAGVCYKRAEKDFVLATALWESELEEITHPGEIRRHQWRRPMPPDGARAWKSAFRVGAACELRRRLQADREEASKTKEATTALVLRKTDEGAERALARFFPLAKAGKPVRAGKRSADGYGAGHRAGKTIGIHKGLSGGDRQTLR